MTVGHYDTIDSVLLLVSEARERAEGAARAASAEGSRPGLVEALQAADRELLALHKRLFDDIYLAGLAKPESPQLELDAA